MQQPYQKNAQLFQSLRDLIMIAPCTHPKLLKVSRAVEIVMTNKRINPAIPKMNPVFKRIFQQRFIKVAGDPTQMKLERSKLLQLIGNSIPGLGQTNQQLPHAAAGSQCHHEQTWHPSKASCQSESELAM